MLFKALSAAVYGIDAHIIDVEVDFSGIQEAQERFSHRRAAGRCGARKPRSRSRCHPQLRLFSSADAHHHQSGACRSEEGRIRLRSADRHRHPGRAGRTAEPRPEPVPDCRRTGAGWQRARCAGHAADCSGGEAARHRQPDCPGVECAGGRCGRRTECVSGGVAAAGARAAERGGEWRHPGAAVSREFESDCWMRCSITHSTSKTCAGKPSRSARSRSQLPAGTTS